MMCESQKSTAFQLLAKIELLLFCFAKFSDEVKLNLEQLVRPNAAYRCYCDYMRTFKGVLYQTLFVYARGFCTIFLREYNFPLCALFNYPEKVQLIMTNFAFFFVVSDWFGEVNVTLKITSCSAYFFLQSCYVCRQLIKILYQTLASVKVFILAITKYLIRIIIKVTERYLMKINVKIESCAFLHKYYVILTFKKINCQSES